MTDKLPEQMHAPRSTAVATRPEAGAYDLGGEDIRLPRMKIGQSQSPAVTDRLVNYGDVFVLKTKDDVEPVILQDNDELAFGALSDPIRFYVHSVRRGVNFRDPSNPDAGYNGMVLGPWGCTVLEFIQQNPQIDPTVVYRKYDYTLTVPEYPNLPVAFLMASTWGGSAASDLNRDIQLARSRGEDPATIAFRLQVKPSKNDKGSFCRAYVGLSSVPEKDKQADQELVAKHKLLLPHAIIEDDDVEATTSTQATEAPSIS